MREKSELFAGWTEYRPSIIVAVHRYYINKVKNISAARKILFSVAIRSEGRLFQVPQLGRSSRTRNRDTKECYGIPREEMARAVARLPDTLHHGCLGASEIARESDIQDNLER